MNLPFDLNTFLHCPQGPRLEGEARAGACKVLTKSIEHGQVMTAAQLLMQDPSLITAMVTGKLNTSYIPAVELASYVGLDVFVLFALAHGMPADALLEMAINRRSPGLVSCALLYRADPNQIANSSGKRSLLDTAVRDICSSGFRKNSPEYVNTLQIAYMLLDADANPTLPAAANSSIWDICLKSWGAKDAELHRVFTEIMKRTKSVEGVKNSHHLIPTALEAKNHRAVEILITAGVPVDPVDLYARLERNELSEHIPAFKALIEQRQKSPVPNAVPTSSSEKAPQRNLAPEWLLVMKQGARLEGEARADACRLLDMALTQGCFVTATKVLAMDPSLITESLGEDGCPKKPVMQKAIAAGMTALVPFALAHGMHVDDPGFGAARGLLEVGINRRSPSLVSYALLNRADPNQLAASMPKRNPLPAALTFLDKVAKRACDANATVSKTDEDLTLGSMLMDAGARADVAGAANIALQYVCALSWSKLPHPVYDDIREEILSLMLDRGGAACADRLLHGKPAVRLAAEAGNIDAVTQLVKAGANTDPAVLGADLFALVKAGGGAEDLPALAELLMKQQIAREPSVALQPSVIVADNAESLSRRKACGVL